MLLLKILIAVIIIVYIGGWLLGMIGLFMSFMGDFKKNPEDEIDTIEIIIEKVNKDDNKEDS